MESGRYPAVTKMTSMMIILTMMTIIIKIIMRMYPELFVCCSWMTNMMMTNMMMTKMMK